MQHYTVVQQRLHKHQYQRFLLARLAMSAIFMAIFYSLNYPPAAEVAGIPFKHIMTHQNCSFKTDDLCYNAAVLFRVNGREDNSHFLENFLMMSKFNTSQCLLQVTKNETSKDSAQNKIN